MFNGLKIRYFYFVLRCLTLFALFHPEAYIGSDYVYGSGPQSETLQRSAPESLSSLSLPDLWRLEEVAPLSGVDLTTLQTMSQWHVLFVGGLLNEVGLHNYI